MSPQIWGLGGLFSKDFIFTLVPKLIHAFGIVLFWIDETKELLFDLGVVNAPLEFGVVVVLGEP